MSLLDDESDERLVELARAEKADDTRPFEIFRPGDALEIRGQRGVLKAITATQTLLEQETGVTVVANSVFLDETIRR